MFLSYMKNRGKSNTDERVLLVVHSVSSIVVNNGIRHEIMCVIMLALYETVGENPILHIFRIQNKGSAYISIVGTTLINVVTLLRQ